MTLTIVTSFNKDIWDHHGKTCITSWLEHLDGDTATANAPAYNLVLYIDGTIPKDLPSGPNISVKFLDNYPDYCKFLRETEGVNMPPNVPPQHQFRFEFRRFWPKVCAISDGFNIASDMVLWLDADILITKDIDVDTLVRDGNKGQIVCLDRGQPWFYMDSGFLLLTHDTLANPSPCFEFVNALYNIYTTKTIFKLSEWHDAFLMSQVINILWGENKDQYVKSLSGLSSSLHPLEDSWLKDYMVHLKGQRKMEANQVVPVVPAIRNLADGEPC